MNLLRGLGYLVPLILLSACAQTPSISGILSSSGTLSTDPADPCGQQRQSFSEGQNYFAQTILTKVAQGAMANGMNSLMTGNVSGVWTNMVSGGVAGLKAGYWDAMQQQNSDRQQLAQSINSDLQRESLAIDHTTAAFATLRTCRFAQARRIKDEARVRRIDHAEAQRELTQEHDWFSQEIAVAQNAGINMQKRDDQFAYAAENLHKEDAGAPRTAARPRAEAAITTSATETIPQKRNSFESSVKEAQAESTTAFSLDSNAVARERSYA